MRTLFRLAPLLIVVIGACESTTPPPVPTSVVLDRTSISISDGDTARLSVTVLDQRGDPMDSLPSSSPLTWTSSAPRVALVEGGLVRGTGPGSASIEVSVGEAKAAAEVEVKAVAVGFRPASDTWLMGTVAAPLEDSIGVHVHDRSMRSVPGARVRFTALESSGTLSAETVTTNARGYARVAWALGPVAGLQTAEVRVEGLQGRIQFVAQAAPGPAVEVRTYGGNAQSGSAGAPLPLPVEVRVSDALGNVIPDHPVAWSVASGGGSVSPESTLTGSTGIASATWTLGSAGDQTLQSTASGLAPILFTASLDGSSSAPEITSVSPARMEPGTTALVSGERFGSDASAVRVSVASVDARVLSVTPTTVQFRVPPRNLLPCVPGGAVPVVVTVDGASGSTVHPLEVPKPHGLAVGQAVSLATEEEVACIGLPDAGEYLITVASTASTIGGMVPIHVRAMGTATSPSMASLPRPSAGGATGLVAGTDRNAEERHHALLESSRRVLERLPPRPSSPGGPLLSRAGSLPSVGDTIAFRIPDVQASNLCTGYFTAQARVVYVGDKAIALEDVAAPLAGTIDSRINAVAAEYDSDMHPILREYFGDPLAMDAALDGDGRLYMFFTERVNQSGNLGFVWGGNFADASACPSSNEAEVFYAAVPTTQDGGFGAETPDNWSWTIRNVLIHEVKHLASYAERLAVHAAGGALRLEDLWLEEATARVSEEIWARTAYGYAQNGNTSHAQSIYCEVRPTWSECAGKPKVMINHLMGLYEWYRSGGSRTPLGRVTYGDWSFYGSGWSMARWAADHSGGSEAHFFRTLTAGREPGGTTLVGAANLEARTGMAFPDIVQNWAVALAVDDYPGVNAADPLHTFPSWNLRDLYAGLNADFPNSWTAAAPALIRPVPLNGSAVSFYQLSGGSAAYWSVDGDDVVLELRGSDSIGLVPYVRVTVIRTR